MKRKRKNNLELQYLPPSTYAKRKGISRQRVYQLMNEKRLEVIRIEGRPMVRDLPEEDRPVVKMGRPVEKKK